MVIRQVSTRSQLAFRVVNTKSKSLSHINKHLSPLCAHVYSFRRERMSPWRWVELSLAVSTMSSCATTTCGLKWETVFTSSHMVYPSPGLPGEWKFIYAPCHWNGLLYWLYHDYDGVINYWWSLSGLQDREAVGAEWNYFLFWTHLHSSGGNRTWAHKDVLQERGVSEQPGGDLAHDLFHRYCIHTSCEPEHPSCTETTFLPCCFFNLCYRVWVPNTSNNGC